MPEGLSPSLPLFSQDSIVDWKVSARPVAYGTALDFMEKRVQGIAGGQEAECIWLLEHPPLYTAGTSADAADLVDPDRFPVHRSGRGGQYTYHGPGQRVAYVMLDLNRRRRDIRLFVEELEHWIIDTLARGNIHGERRDERVGIWVRHERDGLAREDKIAAIGVRVRKWVTFHGISLNISPDLGHFSGIVPCGIPQYGVTSYADLGLEITMSEVDTVLRQAFDRRFGRTTTQDGHPA